MMTTGTSWPSSMVAAVLRASPMGAVVMATSGTVLMITEVTTATAVVIGATWTAVMVLMVTAVVRSWATG